MPRPRRQQQGADVDVAIVGGGVVGLATAYRLLEDRPDLEVVVLEAGDDVGQQQSARNSGVLHAGLYYRPGSAKARWPRAGKPELERFCADHGVPLARTGKLVVVAVDRDELPALDALAQRAHTNGVEIHRLGAPGGRDLHPAGPPVLRTGGDRLRRAAGRPAPRRDGAGTGRRDGGGLPFLGVHLTRRVDGQVWVGPNAVPALARTGRTPASTDLADTRDLLTFPGTRHLAGEHWRVGLEEAWRDRVLPVMVRAVQRYVPAIERAHLRTRSHTPVRQAHRR